MSSFRLGLVSRKTILNNGIEFYRRSQWGRHTFSQVFGTFSKVHPCYHQETSRKAKTSVLYISVITCSNTPYLPEMLLQAPQFCLSSTSREVCQHLELDWAKSRAMAKKAIIRTLALLWVKWEAIEGFEARVCDINHSSQSYCYSVYPFMWIRKWCPFLWAVIAPGWMSWQAEHRLDFSSCCPLLPYFRTLCIVYSLCTHIQWPCLSVLCGE